MINGASERWLRDSFRALGIESLIALLPITLFSVWALLFFAAQRYFIQGATISGLKG